MIKHLLALPEAKEHEWILYVRPGTATTEFKTKTINLPFLWTQLGLAYRTWTANLDCLWVPAHTLPVLRKPGLKTVVTIHGIEYEFLPSYQNLLQRWYLPLSTKYAVQSAKKVIAVSQFTANQLKERLNVDSSKVTVVYEGDSYTSPQPSPKLRRGGSMAMEGEVLKKYALRTKGYILFIGTVQPRKNLKRLIEAYNLTHPTGSSLSCCRRGKEGEVDLVLVGKLGWGFDDLPIDKYPNIKFLRYINDAERDILLQNALVYIQPSITEGFGLPILEAFAAGVPVTSSNGGALPEVVGDAGLLFDPYDVSDIYDQLVKLVDDKKLRDELIAKGHKQLAKFSWQKAAQETYSILTDSWG